MKLPVIEAQNMSSILRRYPVALAYVFGSAATGNFTKGSDVDVAIVFMGGIGKEKRFEMRLALMAQLANRLKRRVDVAVLNDIPSLFFHYIIVKEGKSIFRRSEAMQVEFESGVMGRYFDFAPFISLYNQHYVKRGHQ